MERGMRLVGLGARALGAMPDRRCGAQSRPTTRQVYSGRKGWGLVRRG